MITNQDARQMVTLHAVTRFCQRVLNVPQIEGQYSARQLAEAHCQSLNLTIDQVSKMILTDNVLIGVKYGRDRVCSDLFTAVIENGRVMTVFVGGDYIKPKRRQKIQTKREGRRGFARMMRRRK